MSSLLAPPSSYSSIRFGVSPGLPNPSGTLGTLIVLVMFPDGLSLLAFLLLARVAHSISPFRLVLLALLALSGLILPLVLVRRPLALAAPAVLACPVRVCPGCVCLRFRLRCYLLFRLPVSNYAP